MLLNALMQKIYIVIFLQKQHASLSQVFHDKLWLTFVEKVELQLVQIGFF
jgi:hypothetical protein